jgi:23S rRNA pseudouridine1911/1915/1917 synthase
MISISYEDQWLLVVDKPAGLLVIPTPKNETHTLTNELNQKLIKEGIPYRLHPCHRLDRDTSGLIIYAKGKAVQKRMMDEFKNRKIKKAYVAFVQGELPKFQGEIRNPIDGQSALTRYKVVKRQGGFSVVEAMPVTGRKNQIRIHFKQIGNPILGDTRFVFRRHFKVKASRLCLHAKSLEFAHPVTKEIIKIESELPEKMRGMLLKGR